MRTIHTLAVALASAALLSSGGARSLFAQSTAAQEELLAQYRQAEDLTAKGRIEDAIRLYERIVERAPEVFGAKTKNTANMMNNLAELYRRKQQYAKAQPLYERSLKINEEILGKEDLATAASLENLSQNYYETKEYAQAEPLLRRCIQIREDKLGKDHLRVGDSVASLAIMYFESARYAEAEPLFQRVLAIREASLGKDAVMVSVTLNGLALVYRELGRYDKAEPLLRRSLRIWEAQFGKDHPQVGNLLSNLAVLYRDLGQYDKAEPLFLRSLAIREAKLGKDHPDVATGLNNMAALYVDMRQYGKAESLYARSLRIVETQQGKDHPDVAILLNNIAAVYLRSGQGAKAEAPLQRALKSIEAKLGPDHPQMATLLFNLAVLRRAEGDDAKAVSLAERALKIREAKFGPQHPELGNMLNFLAKLEAAQGHIPSALEATDRMRRLDRRHAARTLPILAENEQLAFLQNIDRRHAQLAYTLALEGKTPEAAALSAAWVLNGKAIAHQTLAERALLARDARNTLAAPLVAELTSLRRQLTTLVLAPYAAATQARRLKEIARLTAREQELSAQLGTTVGRPIRTDPWVELAEVRRAIPSDAVLIEVVRFDVVDYKAKTPVEETKGSRYAAWLIPPAGQGAVKVVDLGDAEPIDRAVQAVRDGIRAAQGSARQKSTILDKGEADAEKEFRPALTALARLVLEPLAGVLDDKTKWIVSPDGALWLVPWAALPLADGSYSIEKHQISYVTSGRELVAPATKAPAKRDGSLLVADPDFDLDPREALSIAARLLGAEPPPSDALALASRSPEGLTSAGILGKVTRLEATAQEATEIRPNLKKYAGEDPWVYRGKNAQEAVVKAFRSPKVIVLSTHGFFLEAQEFKPDERSGLSETKRPLLVKDGKLPENPLLRCGLLLACCNRTAGLSSHQEDGVLTGLEIVGLELRGTELVVLSACETGLGQIHNGEGVAGLRQAFQLAGAQTVVASLWQVADRDTAVLMSDFFDALARGKSKAGGLREAQLARLKSHRERYGAAHPFFWAAFTATGK